MKIYSYIIYSALLMLTFSVNAQTLAFQGADGAGKYTVGGRGGEVYYVTSLQDTLTAGDKKTHEGNLRWCTQRKGPKIILFKVAGIIHLSRRLPIRDSTTILGQSAPGDGICIADENVKIDGDNVILRYLRFRLGDVSKTEDDAITGNYHKNIIVDHCSMSWCTDECASFYANQNFTLQWCIISESLRYSVHHKGSHGYGGIWGGQTATFHHNLIADHDSRNPRMCGSRFTDRADLELVDFRNNVIYNWGSNSSYGAEGGCYNYINNYYKPTATSSNKKRIVAPNADVGDYKQKAGVWGKFYVDGNYVDRYPKVTKNNILGFQPNPETKDKSELLVNKPFDVSSVQTDDAQTAYQRVLAEAGANFRRDSTDRRIIHEVRNGLTPIKSKRSQETGTRPGMVDSQSDVGGWDNYTFDPKDVIEDKNIDGIPDGWLEKYFPGKKATDLSEKGYSYLEVFWNGILNKNHYCKKECKKKCHQECKK